MEGIGAGDTFGAGCGIEAEIPISIWRATETIQFICV